MNESAAALVERAAPIRVRQDNPKKVLKELMALRDPWYRDVADLVVNSKAQSAKSLARMIHEQLEHKLAVASQPTPHSTTAQAQEQ